MEIIYKIILYFCAFFQLILYVIIVKDLHALKKEDCFARRSSAMLCITKELDEKIERIEYTGYEKDEVVFFDIE